ncbi:MAG: hypothetical protein QF903_02570 [Planctomycetota bacterium]|jgi:hypothetical protein|nr:hypothetical protein [Planctomycetota bacterium]MDP6988345.1 hypothetical protein [Planctomycetota bacterium]
MTPRPEGEGRTRVVAGIDEAGLGPLLGPLTLGYAALRVPLGAQTLWERLADAVSEDPRAGGEKLVVCDSKRVFSRTQTGRARLETTALGFAAVARGETPASGGALLESGPQRLRPAASELERHPWYAHLPPRLPMWTDPGRLELRAERLRRAAVRSGVEVVACAARVVPVGELNRSWRRTKNKNSTVWAHVAAILRELWEAHGAEGLSVVVDRQGGRSHYAAGLLRAFPEADFRALAETPVCSVYRLATDRPRRSMLVWFCERGEERSLPTALASCAAKYAREVCMGAFNRYFEGLQPGLRPTAGYTSDGRRWMRDAAGALEAAGLPREVLVRER